MYIRHYNSTTHVISSARTEVSLPVMLVTPFLYRYCVRPKSVPTATTTPIETSCLYHVARLVLLYLLRIIKLLRTPRSFPSHVLVIRGWRMIGWSRRIAHFPITPPSLYIVTTARYFKRAIFKLIHRANYRYIHLMPHPRNGR